MTLRAVVLAVASSLVSALMLGTLATARADEGFSTLSTDEVSKLLGEQDVRVFDANGPDVYEKAHLPGAVLVDRKNLERMLPTDRSTRLIFYCKNPH